jgi:hypothetical protein
MMRREVIPILVGATPLDVAKYTQVGVVLLSIMSITALCLFKSFPASIAPEWAFKRFADVSGSSRRRRHTSLSRLLGLTGPFSFFSTLHRRWHVRGAEKVWWYRGVKRRFNAFTDNEAGVTNNGGGVFGKRCPTPFTDAMIQSRPYRRTGMGGIFLNARVSGFRGGAPQPA